jgi:hypothetical protein
MASGPAAPSTIAMMMTEVHARSSPHRTPSLRSLIAADTCADVRVFVGRRLLPTGPPAEERKEGREGRERPGLPRIWVGTGPASRVAHAPCQCPDRPDKRGPDRVQIRTRLRAQIQITIAPAVVLAIELPRCRTVGSRTNGRSPVHAEAVVRLKQVGDLPAVESTTRLRDWCGDVLRIGRRQHLLFVSERLRSPVVIPIRQAKQLRTVLPDAVCQMMAAVRVAAHDIVEEHSRMSELALAAPERRNCAT